MRETCIWNGGRNKHLIERPERKYRWGDTALGENIKFY